MKKVAFATVLLLLLSSSVSAQGAKFGVGVFGGLDIPVGQEDQAQGTVFGARAKVKLIPLITLEPTIAFTSFGEPSSDEFALDLDGSKITAYGANAVIGAPFGGKGFAMFGVLGAGFYNVKRDQTFEDNTELGWSAGLGFAIGFSPMLQADVRGVAHVIPFESGGTAKSASVTAGLNYYLGM